MKSLLRIVISILLLTPAGVRSQCTSTNATTCQCPTNGATNCDLLPDISIARLPLTQASNYAEYPQVCNPPCSGNDGRLRLGVSTPIIGFGPLETRGTSKYVCGTDTLDAGTIANIPTACPVTGLPPKQLINQRIYHKNGSTMSFYDRPAGSMTYHATHGHQHVDDWGIYTLRSNNGDPNPVNWPIIGTGAKLGFCLLDISSCASSGGYCTDSAGNTLNDTNIKNYGLNGLTSGTYSCSNVVQGITNGWMDTYSQGLDGMWINIPAGVCNGTYWIVVQIDPRNYFLELNENNNVVAVPFTLTKQSSAPVITAGGATTFCTGGSVTLTASSSPNYLWSNGASSQAITVNTSGNYTVSTTCGATTATSSPITVTVTSIAVTASASPSSATCNGDAVQLSAGASSSGFNNVPVTFTNNTPLFIPDYPAAAVNSPITVTGINPTTLSATSVVSVNLTLTHTYDSDLQIALVSPSGTSMFLSNRQGGGNDNFINTTFSMSAATLISAGAAPFTGSFKPDGNFSSLTGNANGLWQLRVQDLAGVDTGRIQNWSLTIFNQVPETLTYSWSSVPAGYSSSQQNPLIHPTSSATYSVLVTSSATSCTGTNSAAVTVPPLVALNNFSPSSGGPGTTVTINGSNMNSVSGVKIAGNTCSFTVINSNQILATVPNTTTQTGTICLTNSGGCMYCSSGSFTISPSVTLNLRMFIQGLYMGGGLMNNVLYLANMSNNPNASDSIIVELHNPTDPYALVASVKTLLLNNGNASLSFPSSVFSHSYFIVVRHRNAIETWSKSPVPFNTSLVSFDFTTP